MKLIREQTFEDAEVIVEKKDDGVSDYKIQGIFMQADIKNRNGRIYPFEVLNKAVSEYNKNFIAKKRAFGELGHPEGPTVNLERTSHMISKLEVDGKNFIGEAKIVDTEMGKIVKTLLGEGATLAVSSRGIGNLEEKDGAKVVGKNFYLATAADIVADPSAPNSFVEGIMEGKEWIFENGKFIEVGVESFKENVDKEIRQGTPSAEALTIEFENFMNRLSIR